MKIIIECFSCNGTGLYQGFAEKKDCAVVCCGCGGKGFVEFSYKEFKKRKIKKGIKRVFKSSCGYGHQAQDFTNPETGVITRFSQAGCTYKEWLNGKEPKPVKELYCPYLWTGQSLQSKDKNNLYKERCNCGVSLGNSITSCKFYEDKDLCWRIFQGG